MSAELSNGWRGVHRKNGRYIWFNQPGRDVFLFTEFERGKSEFGSDQWVATVISFRGITKNAFDASRDSSGFSRKLAMDWAMTTSDEILKEQETLVC